MVGHVAEVLEERLTAMEVTLLSRAQSLTFEFGCKCGNRCMVMSMVGSTRC
jgi:hypothetical protein